MLDRAERIATNAELGPIPEGFAGQVVFDLHTPCGGDELKANIVATSARGLPDGLADAPLLRIFAGGPSAREAPLSAYFGPTLALNGALKLFTDRGLAPTYWACCDPQGLLVEKFLTGELPESTVYLVASKCPAVVFDRLEGRDVRIWHVSDFAEPSLNPVPCGSSVTTSSLMLALRLGYPRQEIWGWDCCFGEDGSTHANSQEHFYHEVIDCEIDGRHFKSTRSWLLEAEDLGNKVWPVLQWLGCDIRIMGDGMLRAYVRGSNATF